MCSAESVSASVGLTPLEPPGEAPLLRVFVIRNVFSYACGEHIHAHYTRMASNGVDVIATHPYTAQGMLRIRMMRFGRKHQPSYRVVVLPRGTKSGRSKYVESLGWVDPLQKKHEINADRAKYWLHVGAQPSDTVWNLFVRDGIVEGPKRKKGKAGIMKKADPVESSDAVTEKTPADEPAKDEPLKEEATPDTSTDKGTEETDKS